MDDAVSDSFHWHFLQLEILVTFFVNTSPVFYLYFPNSTLKCDTLWGGGVLPTASGRMTISMSSITENCHVQELPPAGL